MRSFRSLPLATNALLQQHRKAPIANSVAKVAPRKNATWVNEVKPEHIKAFRKRNKRQSLKASPRVKPMVHPKVEPKVEPKVDPKVAPKVEPKVEPMVKPMVLPTVEPKVEPNTEPVKVRHVRVNPVKVDPVKKLNSFQSYILHKNAPVPQANDPIKEKVNSPFKSFLLKRNETFNTA